MNTPAGQECKFYYQDFHRGNNRQECRLLDENPHSPAWKERDCFDCPVPGILRANASEDLRLRGTVKPGLVGIGRHVAVDAFCRKHDRRIDDPYVGCAQCAAERPNIADLFADNP